VGELAAAFNAMADSLASAEERRREFISNVSHELKTPMTTIAGFSDGILDGTIPPEKEREALMVVSSETRRLSRLVRRMLDLSQLQAKENDTITAQEQFDISEIMCRVLVSLESKVNARHLDVDCQIPEEPVTVWGDPDGITQVCYNLLDNAIKFSTEGETLGISVSANKNGKAYISVRNKGEPIPPDELDLIFDRFHKSDQSRSVDKEGVGLGLYIVKTILNNHKENITVTSEEGVTEFTFTLALVK
jgi:signal transduction histidine kinase